jgi:hypothetical protein
MLLEDLTTPFPFLSSSLQGRGGRQGMNMIAGDVGGSGSGTGTGIVVGGMQVRMHHVLA